MCQEHVPESGTTDKKKAINQVHADYIRLAYHDCHMKAMLLLPGLVPGRERSLKFMLQRKDGTIF